VKVTGSANFWVLMGCDVCHPNHPVVPFRAFDAFTKQLLWYSRAHQLQYVAHAVMKGGGRTVPRPPPDQPPPAGAAYVDSFYHADDENLGVYPAPSNVL